MYALSNSRELDFFRNNRCISAARLYIYVKKEFNKHFHTSQISQVCNDLQITRSTVYNNLRTMIDLGIVEKYSTGYWRFKAASNFCEGKYRKVVIKNIRHLRNLTDLNAISYYSAVRSSIQMTKRNIRGTSSNSSRAKSPGRKNPLLRKEIVWTDCSSSWINLVTGINKSESYLSRIVKRLIKLEYLASADASGKKCERLIEIPIDRKDQVAGHHAQLCRIADELGKCFVTVGTRSSFKRLSDVCPVAYETSKTANLLWKLSKDNQKFRRTYTVYLLKKPSRKIGLLD